VVARASAREADTIKTGYAEMALASWSLFDLLRKEGVVA
jgi:hypothetical protein